MDAALHYNSDNTKDNNIADNDAFIKHPDPERFLVELGYSRSPLEILALLRKEKPINLDYLNGYDTCSELQLGKLLGEGKTGSVYELQDPSHKGLPVVIKEFTMKEGPKVMQNKSLYILPSALNDIVMSSIFHSFFDGGTDFCLSFPYFEGFFVCGKTGYSIIEKLDRTFSKYTSSADFSADRFRIVFFQVLYGIKFMNRKHVVHNDMHGKNVMIRTTKGISYRGIKLDDVKTFAYIDGDKTYYHPNLGIIGKIVDFDFASKYSSPKVVAKKVYDKQEDDWNLQFRFSTSYDMLTFVAYMVYYTHIKTPGNGALKQLEINEIKRTVESVAEYIVEVAERNTGQIRNLKHYEFEKNGKTRKRDAISKLMDMVSVPQYRPYEKYCHLDLSGVLDLGAFRHFKERREYALVVANI